MTDEFLDRYLRDIKTVAITNPDRSLATLLSEPARDAVPA